jgi:exodeoxyribonuclease VII small subunit
MNDETDQNTQLATLSFEDALMELEGIIASLERGEVSLDAAISAFERGTELKILCQTRLEEARMKVEKIKIPEAGGPPRDVSVFEADET